MYCDIVYSLAAAHFQKKAVNFHLLTTEALLLPSMGNQLLVLEVSREEP